MTFTFKYTLFSSQFIRVFKYALKCKDLIKFCFSCIFFFGFFRLCLFEFAFAFRCPLHFIFFFPCFFRGISIISIKNTEFNRNFLVCTKLLRVLHWNEIFRWMLCVDLIARFGTQAAKIQFKKRNMKISIRCLQTCSILYTTMYHCISGLFSNVINEIRLQTNEEFRFWMIGTTDRWIDAFKCREIDTDNKLKLKSTQKSHKYFNFSAGEEVKSFRFFHFLNLESHFVDSRPKTFELICFLDQLNLLNRCYRNIFSLALIFVRFVSVCVFFFCFFHLFNCLRPIERFEILMKRTLLGWSLWTGWLNFNRINFQAEAETAS